MKVNSVGMGIQNVSKMDKKQYSIGKINENMADTFEKSNNNVSFKGVAGMMKGGAIGAVVGGLVGVFVVAATAGTAIPFLAAYYAGLGATAVTGAVIGDKIEGKDD